MWSRKQRIYQCMKTDKLSDRDIIDGIVSTGNAKDFVVLVDRYKTGIFALVASMVTEREDAEEVAQDCFVRAYQRLRQYDPQQGSFYTWLRTIAYRLSLDYLRRRPGIWLDTDEQMLANITDEEADSVMDTDDDRKIALLIEAIRLLPPTERLLIQQYYFEEQPLKEIALVTGTDSRTLATRLHRIRKKLYQYIKTKEHGTKQTR